MHKWIEKILSQMNSQTRGHKGNKIDLEDLENRINFASSECGAKVTATNAEARESSSILVGSKDRYLLTPCDVDRWVVIQLCEEVGIEIIQLANYEFFSSMFKDFMVYGTNKYQEEKTEWTLIGNFTAQNKRTIQHFTFEEIAWWK